MNVKPGDLLLARTNNRIGYAIRYLTRHLGESRSRVNHAGIVWDERNSIEANPPRAGFCSLTGRKDKIAIFRHKRGFALAHGVLTAASDMVGWKYGTCALIMSALDWLLFEHYVFRRLTRNSIVCSTLVARAYASVGIKFGVDPCAATPDDLWDWVKSHPTDWQCVYDEGV